MKVKDFGTLMWTNPRFPRPITMDRERDAITWLRERGVFVDNGIFDIDDLRLTETDVYVMLRRLGYT